MCELTFSLPLNLYYTSKKKTSSLFLLSYLLQMCYFLSLISVTFDSACANFISVLACMCILFFFLLAYISSKPVADGWWICPFITWLSDRMIINMPSLYKISEAARILWWIDFLSRVNITLLLNVNIADSFNSELWAAAGSFLFR